MSLSSNNSLDTTKKSNKEEKILAKNTFYSLLTNSSNFLFSIITVFIIARLISKDDWSILILATSLVTIFSLALIFLPPSLGLSIIYYATEFKALNQNNKFKSFIKNSLILRTLFGSIIFFITILIFLTFENFFTLNRKDYVIIFFLLSPQIIMNGLSDVFNSAAQTLNMFKLNYILLLIKNAIYIGGLILLYFFKSFIEVYHIAAAVIVSILVPFIVQAVIILFILKFKIKKTEESKESLRDTFKKIYKYGSYLTVIDFSSAFNIEMTTQLTGYYQPASTVTGYRIADRYRSIPSLTIASIFRPLAIYFTRLVTNKQIDQIKKAFNLLFNYLLTLMLIITGVLFFSVEIFLVALYTESYLTFSTLVKVCLLIPIFTIQNSFFDGYFMATNKVKLLSIVSVGAMFLRLGFFTIGIVFFDILVALYLVILEQIIVFIVQILILRRLNINLKIKKPLILYSSFFIALFTSWLLSSLFLNNIYVIILDNLGLSFFHYWNLPSIILYLLIFLGIIIIFKVFTKSDIEKVESIFQKDNISHNIIRKALNVSKKIMRG